MWKLSGLTSEWNRYVCALKEEVGWGGRNEPWKKSPGAWLYSTCLVSGASRLSLQVLVRREDWTR